MSQIDPNKKKQLDANIREMLKKGASQEDVIRYANDFNKKFALKKKDQGEIPSAGVSIPKEATSLLGGGVEKQAQPSVSSTGIANFPFGKSSTTFQEQLSSGEAKVGVEKQIDKRPSFQDIDTKDLKFTPTTPVKTDMSGNPISVIPNEEINKNLLRISKDKEEVERIKGSEDFKIKQQQGVLPPTSDLIERGELKLEITTGDGGVSDFLKPKSFEEKIKQQVKDPIEKAKESSKNFKINYDNLIESRDLDLENPYLYYSKEKDGDREVTAMYSEELPGINIQDFDGFLRKNGYLDQFNRALEKGDFKSNQFGYSGNLMSEKKLVDYLKLYLEDKTQREFEKNAILYKKKNPNATFEEIKENVKVDGPTSQQELDLYIKDNFPNYADAVSKRKKKESDEYQETLRNKGEFFSWQTPKKVLKGVYDTTFKRVNELSSTVADVLGFEDIAKQFRYEAEEFAFENPQSRDVTYVSGKKVLFDGNDYLVDQNGQIYDYNIKKRVTDLFDKDTYDSLIEASKKGVDDDMFSWTGQTVQLTNVIADLSLQILATKGVGGATSLATRGLTKEGLAMLSKIPISKEMASSAMAQTFLGYSEGLETTYAAAKRAGIKDYEAKELANDAAIRMAELYLITSGISPQTKAAFAKKRNELISDAVESYSKQGRKVYLNAIDNAVVRLKDFAEGGVRETAQEITQQAGTVYGVNALTNEKVGNDIVQSEITGDELISMLPSTFIAGGLPVMIRNKNNGLFSRTNYLDLLDTASNNVDLSNKRLNELLSKDAITQEEYDKSKEDLRVYASNKHRVPKNISPKIALDVMRSLDEISKLENQKKNLDPSFYENIDEQINQRREEVKKLYSQPIEEEEEKLPDVISINENATETQGEILLELDLNPQKKVDNRSVSERQADAESKIKRKDLFTGVGEFSTELGGSDKAAVPVSHNENNGIEVVEYAHPDTGEIDVIVTGTSNNDYVGFYRLYENGKPTNKWSSKFENKSRNKDNFKTMISSVQDLLPEGHQYTEKTSISTDGLRVWNQQLSKGYDLQYDENGNVITNRVRINGDAITNELGIDVNKGNFESIRATKEEFENIKKALIPYMEKLGLGPENIHYTSGGPAPGSKGSVSVDLPILTKSKTSDGKESKTENIQENSLPLFEKFSGIETTKQKNKFTKENPTIAFVDSNIDGIVNSVEGAQFVEC